MTCTDCSHCGSCLNENVHGGSECPARTSERQLKKERDAAYKRFEAYAINNTHWGVENSIMKDALEQIIRAVPLNKDAKLACEGLKDIAREAIKEMKGEDHD